MLTTSFDDGKNGISHTINFTVVSCLAETYEPAKTHCKCGHDDVLQLIEEMYIYDVQTLVWFWHVLLQKCNATLSINRCSGRCCYPVDWWLKTLNVMFAWKYSSWFGKDYCKNVTRKSAAKMEWLKYKHWYHSWNFHDVLVYCFSCSTCFYDW